MAIGLIGRKCGMTRIFTEDGESIPVTVVEVEANRIAQVKTEEKDGYSSIQVTTGAKKASRLSKSESGHFAKAGVVAGRGLWEFQAEGEYTVGQELTVELFEAGQLVDVTGQSKGKGFQGAIKRWNFSGQDRSHGNSLSHRALGSTGQCQAPGKVWKGKKMSGQMGAERVTTQNLEVVRVDQEAGLILIKGALPGANGGDVIVRPATKVKA